MKPMSSDVGSESKTQLAPLVGELAAQLGEQDEQPLQQIDRALAILGEAPVRTIIAEALAIEATGGETVMSGKRRRTPGGIFFRLVRERVTGSQRRAIFPAAPGTTPTPAAGQPFTWATFGTLLPRLATDIGAVTTVKITVIGRPKQVLPSGEVIIVTLRSERPPSLPKGLPTPAAPTDYAVLIARKQWQKVEAAIQRPEDKLIIEGYPTHDPRFNGITVLATQVTTRDQQAAKREEQRPAR
jgi:hypothetical protein